MNINKNKVYLLGITITVLCGILLRVFLFLQDNAFWNDECALAFNIINNQHFFYFFKPLSYGQAAPPLFMIISKFFHAIINDIEQGLRLFPFISSILSIFVFYLFGTKVLQKKSSVFVAMILFCFNFAKALFNWAKDKKNPQIFADKHLNLLLKFSL